MRNIHDIVEELRAHPDAMGVIVWMEADIPADIEPDSVNWGHVEDRCVELGNEVIWDLGELKAKGDCTHCGEPANRSVTTEAGTVYECEDCP